MCVRERRATTCDDVDRARLGDGSQAMGAVLQEVHLDRFSALVDAAAARADDLAALFDYVLAIGGLWERLGLRDARVDAQLRDAENRERLASLARDQRAHSRQEQEGIAFYALRTLAALQSVVEDWRHARSSRSALITR